MVCGVEYSTRDQGVFYPLVLIPLPRYSVVDGNLTDVSCRQRNNCPVTILLTGTNQSLGATLSRNLLRRSFVTNYSDLLFSLAENVLATTYKGSATNYLEAGIVSDRFIYNLQPRCTQKSNFSFSVGQPPLNFTKEIGFKQEKYVLLCDSQSAICLGKNSTFHSKSKHIQRSEIFRGYQKGNPEGKINEIVAAYDLLDTNKTNFNVNIWYNATYLEDSGNRPPKLLRVPRLVSLVSNAYLEYLKGPRTRILFEFVKEMPKPETKLRLNIASLIGAVFFTWVILLLFPVILTTLVYEKQQRLRIIMKMHGLGDGPYWMISYAYCLAISTVYVICLMIFGSAIGLKFFLLNDYSLHFVFYFLYINLQISVAFLASSAFSKVETASVVGYIYVFGSGLLGCFLFQFLIEDLSFPRHWIFVMELYPGFSLFRGLYEFSHYAFQGNLTGRNGMKWKDLSESSMDKVFYIIIVEWFFLLITAYYIDKMSSSGKGLLFFLKKPFEKFLSPQRPCLQNQVSTVAVEMEKLDVIQESEKVEKLMLEQSISHTIVCNKMNKEYPGRDGNPPKMEVRGLSFAVPSGECFGMLGPNGAGKTSFINMMTGLVKPTSGSAFVQGLDICMDMDRVYTSMGVCPTTRLTLGNTVRKGASALLWET
uniref:Uncharacterized protein n=1 Tax=Brassica oleracea TaxID=3712 RepID=A0A3P6FD89_BRAOL|nr:unnamed protein product [Brassica oleracea]